MMITLLLQLVVEGSVSQLLMISVALGGEAERTRYIFTFVPNLNKLL